ncbi:ABC transporter ATP-binding protein [Acuticoccus sediminis]|uniref:ABC transporter ATP-binding protein n=1 Tax=Acuticoccus sediminis TaxID=2184697 RepID=A0A8B2NMQ0_9HYPH|nr:ATP-binding cassette domain-containing protein [Acuticoccus sediminis]RAH96753.1 ABC transporter ATP-binding protein [Acuticoccus sediminis]
MTDAIIVDDLTVRFGSLTAINGLSLAIRYGEIHALIGPNGAGKSTLLDVICGVTRPTSGGVRLDHEVELGRTREAGIAALGLFRKFQKPSVFDALTVFENATLGSGHGRWRRPSEAEAERAMATLTRVGLAGRAGVLAGELAHGEKQWLEIAMVVAAAPKVLMLDEPVAGLSDEERDRTASLVRELSAPDCAIVVVEHDMDFVAKIADRVTVLHEGSALFEGSMDKVRADQRVIDVYLGR